MGILVILMLLGVLREMSIVSSVFQGCQLLATGPSFTRGNRFFKRKHNEILSVGFSCIDCTWPCFSDLAMYCNIKRGPMPAGWRVFHISRYRLPEECSHSCSKSACICILGVDTLRCGVVEKKWLLLDSIIVRIRHQGPYS